MAHVEESRRVVVFGSSGVGKSSIVNCLLGNDVFKVSDSARGTTFQTQSEKVVHNHAEYEIFDTCGLDESAIGTVPAALAIENLIKLIKNLGSSGVHLFVYVIDCRILWNTYANYKLFVDIIAQKQVPCVIVVNRCDTLREPKSWAQIDQNLTDIYNTGIRRNVPVISTCFGRSFNDPDQEVIFARKRAASTDALWNLIEGYSVPHYIAAHRSILEIIMDALRALYELLNTPAVKRFVSSALEALLLTAGIDVPVAPVYDLVVQSIGIATNHPDAVVPNQPQADPVL